MPLQSPVLCHRATTHTDLELRARELGIPVKVIHNASIMNAVGVCGLQLYRFGEVLFPAQLAVCTRALASDMWNIQHGHGLISELEQSSSGTRSEHEHAGVQAISLVFFTDTWRPDSFYSRVAANRQRGLHTLVLLDIKVKEPSMESLARGKPVYEPPRQVLWCLRAPLSSFPAALGTTGFVPSRYWLTSGVYWFAQQCICVHSCRFMTVNTAAQQLLEIEADCKGGAYDEDTMCVGLARVGADDQKVRMHPMHDSSTSSWVQN